jgi:hypothetical protein
MIISVARLLTAFDAEETHLVSRRAKLFHVKLESDEHQGH